MLQRDNSTSDADLAFVATSSTCKTRPFNRSCAIFQMWLLVVKKHHGSLIVRVVCGAFLNQIVRNHVCCILYTGVVGNCLHYFPNVSGRNCLQYFPNPTVNKTVFAVFSKVVNKTVSGVFSKPVITVFSHRNCQKLCLWYFPNMTVWNCMCYFQTGLSGTVFGVFQT